MTRGIGLVAIVALNLLPAVRADDLPMVGGSAGSLRSLLGKKYVRDELKLDEKQLESGLKALAAIDAKYQPMIDAAVKRRDFDALKEIDNRKKPETRKVLAEAIGTPATKRLLQLEMQSHRFFSFFDDDIKALLMLTDEQGERIHAIRVAFNKAAGPPPRPGDPLAEYQKLQRAAMTKARAVLTDKQRKTWDDLTGPYFEFVDRP